MAVLTLKGDEIKTFPPILREYASHSAVIKGNGEKTVCEYLMDLRTFFRYYLMSKHPSLYNEDEFEKIDISRINEEDVKSINTQFIVEYLMYATIHRNNTTTTRMRKLSAIRSFFNYAQSRRHIIDVNPTADIDSPQKSRTLPKYLTIEESVKLLQAIKDDTYSKTVIRDYAIVALFLNTGMRLSELVGLNLDNFDSDLKKVVVLGKGKKERIVYLNDAARSAVVDYLRQRLDPKRIITSDKAFFLSKRQTRISNKTVQWMVGKYLDLAGLGGRGLSVHKLRHTAATLMYQSGKVDIRVLKDILGHEQLNTTQIYTHVVDRNLEEAMSNNPLSEVKIETSPLYEDDE